MIDQYEPKVIRHAFVSIDSLAYNTAYRRVLLGKICSGSKSTVEFISDLMVNKLLQHDDVLVREGRSCCCCCLCSSSSSSCSSGSSSSSSSRRRSYGGGG